MADPGMDEADLFRVAIETFIRVRTARRLAALGGSTPDLIDIRRRRDEADTL
nr:type II toxin-antitoxin system VapB family antitoxin [Burkholderia sp. Ax-1719]